MTTPSTRRWPCAFCSRFGYQPEVAANGREALDMLDRQPFDFIFMDVMMPEMDGLEATRLLRKRQMIGGYNNYQSRIIIVAMTAHAMQGDREKCIAAGMDDYLAKPVRPKDVRDMIERWGGKIMPEPKRGTRPRQRSNARRRTAGGHGPDEGFDRRQRRQFARTGGHVFQADAQTVRADRGGHPRRQGRRRPPRGAQLRRRERDAGHDASGAADCANWKNSARRAR